MFEFLQIRLANVYKIPSQHAKNIPAQKGANLDLVQVKNYEMVINFFFISAITWHDIQQLSIKLPEFTQFVQFMKRQNNPCKFV